MTLSIVPPDELPEIGEGRLAPIIRRAWADSAYRAKLRSDPAETLREAGLDIPPHMSVRIPEDTPDLLHLPLPARPEGEVTEEDLERIAAAGHYVISPVFRPIFDDRGHIVTIKDPNLRARGW